jgi:hypothetical protein
MTSSPPELGPEELMYIQKARRAARRFTDAGGGDIEGALEAVKGTAHFDVEVPTASKHREWELVKTGVKRLSVWYMRYLAAQLDDFAANVVHLADALVATTERLESGADELEVRLSAVEERLRQLEAGDQPHQAAKAAAPKPVPAKTAAPNPAPAKPGAPGTSMTAETTATTRARHNPKL